MITGAWQSSKIILKQGICLAVAEVILSYY